MMMPSSKVKNLVGIVAAKSSVANGISKINH